MWITNPRNAPPEWIEIFVGRKLPRTIIIDTKEATLNVAKSITKIRGTNASNLYIEIKFNYEYVDFPSEINLFFESTFNSDLGKPILKLYWEKPNGETIYLADYTIRSQDDRFYITINEKVRQKLFDYYADKGIKLNRTLMVQEILFGDMDNYDPNTHAEVLQGDYKLIIKGKVFGEESDIDVKLVVYGQVYGIAGTDHLRRPLEIALLWGTPIALSFGLIASLVTTFLQMIIATISGWYGGIVDDIIQRLTEVYMVIPFLPFLILISAFYKMDIWIILAVVIILSIFGGGVKSTRALVMQIKEYPYVEAAIAYGASDIRIIFFYIIPKILPPMVPGLIGSVPGYVFLEAALSFLGLGDPYLPTWGKVINDAFSNGALYKGYFYWVLEPSLLLILTALAFSFIGFALDKIVNPRLREI